ncbi:MAG: conjugal transfer protein TrbF [Proteocatella sp.]
MGIKDIFKRPEKFTTYTPKTPAERAEEKVDRRVGSTIVQNHNLRRIIVGLLIVCVLLTIGLVVQSLKSTVIPYVVEVDTSTGMVKNMGPLKENTYTPQESSTTYFLKRFIINTREIPLDPVVYNKQWNTAYAFLTKSASSKMNAEIKNEKITEKLGKKTVQVNIISCLAMEGSNSYHVRWNEEEFSIGSGEKIITPMSGIFTITYIPAKDAETLDVNPLGIYISDFNWSKDATAATTTAKQNVNNKK